MRIRNGKNRIELKTNCIANVPLMPYDEFIFIVNGEEFKTTQLIAVLLSPKIGRFHQDDRTLNTITINTENKGDFSYILNLVSFIEISIPDKEIPFISEVIEFLENEWIEFKQYDQIHEITLDNVFSRISNHEQFPKFYSKFLKEEIDFISSKFYEIDNDQQEEMTNFKYETIEKIIMNENLRIKDEDQLLNFINKLYLKNSNFSNFYEFVIFSNASSETVDIFLEIFDMNNITNEIWKSLSNRLKHEITNEKSDNSIRYFESSENCKIFSYKNDLQFNGILDYLRKLTKGGINDHVSITSSSVCEHNLPQNCVNFEDRYSVFQSNVESDSWICFNFRQHQVAPSSYMIRSYFCNQNMNHPKSWVIEGSDDGFHWKILDEQKNCPDLNGNNLVHSFKISNDSSDKFQYIRMRLTGKNWNEQVTLRIDSFELYGILY